MGKVLEFHANHKQKEALRYLLPWSNAHVTEIGYGGGAGGGKSFIGVAWQWMLRNQYPGTRWFFGRSELKNLKRTTLNSYYKFCEEYKIPEGQRGTFNSQDSVIRYSNGSEILLLDLAKNPSDPLYTRFGSLELTDWFIDESNENDEQAITILSTRVWRHLNDKYGLVPKILETFNPDKGHVYRRFYKANKDGTLPKHRVFIPALATDNPFVSPLYIEQLKKANPVTVQRLLYGNFEYDETPGRLFDYDAIMDMRTNAPINGKKYISCDAARSGKDKAVIYVWDGYEIKAKVEFAKSTNDQIEDKITELQQRFWVPNSQTIVDEDGVGGGIVDHLKCKGFINNSAARSPAGATHTPFLRRNFANLKTQCYFKLAQLVNDRQIRYNPPSSDSFNALAEELDVIVEIDLDKDAKRKIIPKDEIKEKLGRSPDYADAMMMRAYFDLLEYPEPEWEYEEVSGKLFPKSRKVKTMEEIREEWVNELTDEEERMESTEWKLFDHLTS